MTTPRTLVWFRRDLRVDDNTALHHAAARGEVVALWVVSPGEWRAHDDAPVKVDFWLRNVHALAAELAAREVPLRIVHAEAMGDVPAAVLRAAKAVGCDAVCWNREYEVDERRRDAHTAALCATEGVRAEGFDDRVAVAPADVQTDARTPYTVFTPFLRRWFGALKRRGWRTLPAPSSQRRLDVSSSAIPDAVEGFASPVASTPTRPPSCARP